MTLESRIREWFARKRVGSFTPAFAQVTPGLTGSPVSGAVANSNLITFVAPGTGVTGAATIAGAFMKKYTGTAGGSNLVTVPFMPKFFFIMDETAANTAGCMTVYVDADANPAVNILIQNSSVSAGVPTFKTGVTGIGNTTIDIGALSTLVFASQTPMNVNLDVYLMWGFV